MLTPVRNPRTQQERRYNYAHARTRNVIERTFGIMKTRFPVLQDPMRTKLRNSFVIIVAIAVLHNVGITRGDVWQADIEQNDDGMNNVDDQQDDAAAVGNARGNALRRHLIETLF